MSLHSLHSPDYCVLPKVSRLSLFKTKQEVKLSMNNSEFLHFNHAVSDHNEGAVYRTTPSKHLIQLQLTWTNMQIRLVVELALV